MIEIEKNKLRKGSRILFIINLPYFDLNNKNSAVANYLKILYTSLLNDGFCVDFYPSVQIEKDTTFSIQNKRGLISILKKKIKKNIPFFYNSIVLSNYFSLQKKLELSLNSNERYELIIEFYVLGSTLGTRLKSKFGCNYILIYDSPVLVQYQEMYKSRTIYSKKIENAEKSSLASADCILCYSKSVKEYIQTNYSTKNFFYEMPCIVWKGKPVISSENLNEQIIGFIGSFLVWHKVPLLLDAFNSIAATYPNLRLYLIGYGEEWNKVAQLVNASPYKERIYMPGFVSEEELNQIKNKISIGVMPGSNWYGSPLKLFEYAEAGIPIIAPSTPVVLDLFKDKNTALFIDPKGELLSLIENIELLINNQHIADSLSLNAKKLMDKEYSQENQMDNFIKLVQKLLKNGIEK